MGDGDDDDDDDFDGVGDYSDDDDDDDYGYGGGAVNPFGGMGGMGGAGAGAGGLIDPYSMEAMEDALPSHMKKKDTKSEQYQERLSHVTFYEFNGSTKDKTGDG